jgi:isopentenyl-diphosphate delta-isomerase
MRAEPLGRRGVSVAAALVPAPRAREESLLIPAVAADGSLFPIGKMEAHRQGALHLAVSVFVMSGAHVLLQRRASGKYHSAGLWANTCCSHPDWGESPAASAVRRLREELGVSVALRPCAVIDYAADVTDGLREVERVHVFRGDADRRALQIAADPSEVSETRWAPLADIQRHARAEPGAYAPWFRIYLARWAELKLDA